jgi:hypothetical protein
MYIIIQHQQQKIKTESIYKIFKKLFDRIYKSFLSARLSKLRGAPLKALCLARRFCCLGATAYLSWAALFDCRR